MDKTAVKQPLEGEEEEGDEEDGLSNWSSSMSTKSPRTMVESPATTARLDVQALLMTVPRAELFHVVRKSNTVLTDAQLGEVVMAFALQHCDFPLALNALTTLLGTPSQQTVETSLAIANLVQTYVMTHGIVQGVSFFRAMLTYLAKVMLVVAKLDNVAASSSLCVAFSTIRKHLMSNGALKSASSHQEQPQQPQQQPEDIKTILRRAIGPRKWTKWSQLSNDQCIDDAIMEGHGTSMIVSYLLCRDSLPTSQIHDYVVDRARYLAWNSGHFRRCDAMLQSVGLINAVDMLQQAMRTMTTDRGLRTRLVVHLAHLDALSTQDVEDLAYLETLERLIPSSSPAISQRRGWAAFYAVMSATNVTNMQQQHDNIILPASFNMTCTDRSSELFRDQPCCAAYAHWSPRVSIQDFEGFTNKTLNNDLVSGKFLDFSLETISHLDDHDRCRLALECGSQDKKWVESIAGLGYFIDHGDWKNVGEWLRTTNREDYKQVIENVLSQRKMVSHVVREAITRALAEREPHVLFVHTPLQPTTTNRCANVSARLEHLQKS